MIIKNLCKTFDSKSVIHDLTLTIEDGSCTAIMGASGCGKTTLINLILGLVCPDAGSIEDVPQNISVVFQEDRLFDSYSAYDNISSVLPKSDYNKIVPAMTALGLTNINNIPVSKLSGGMRRRVAILRALLHPSEMLIMDEPLKGLDDNTKQICMKYVQENLDGRTFLLITHSEEEACFYTDKILYL